MARPRAHDGSVPSGPHVACGGRGFAVRRGGREHLREPAPVLLGCGPRPVPGRTWRGTSRWHKQPAWVSVLCLPSSEMYPRGEPETRVQPGPLADCLEGASRPGHFAGVATVVTKLLSVSGRCRAFFGEKDFQQLVIVRRLVADLDLDTEVVACPTVRRAGRPCLLESQPPARARRPTRRGGAVPSARGGA